MDRRGSGPTALLRYLAFINLDQKRFNVIIIIVFSHWQFSRVEEQAAGSRNVRPSILGNFCPRPVGKPEAGIQLALHLPTCIAHQPA